MADEHNTSPSSSDSESSSELRVNKSNYVSLWVQNLDDTKNLKLDVSSVAGARTPTSPVNGAAIYFEENSHPSDADDEDDTNFNDFESNRPKRRQAKRKRILMEPDSSSDCEESGDGPIDATPLPEEESPQNHVSCNKLEGPAPSKKVAYADHRGEPAIYFHEPMEPNNCSDCEGCCDCLIDAAPLPEEELQQNHVSNEQLEGPAPSEEA